MSHINNGYNKKYPNIIETGKTNIKNTWIQWLSKNCQKGWGWHWDETLYCKVSFEDKQEAFWFALNYNFEKED